MVTARFYNILFKEGITFESGIDTVTIEITGHSLYNKSGSDIVCAGISAIAQTLVISITRLLKIKQTVIKEDGLLRTEIFVAEIDTEQISGLKLIIDSLLIGLLEIKKEYPGSVEIEFVTD